MSEIYFHMADETVFAAENYSEKIAVKIRTIELLSALDMLCLLILVIMQTLTAMEMAMKNKQLEQRAYMDAIPDCLIKVPVRLCLEIRIPPLSLQSASCLI